jgi:hypothetical protein
LLRSGPSGASFVLSSGSSTFQHYNFCRQHQTLRFTPAIAAGVTDRIWNADGIVGLIDAMAPESKSRGPYTKRMLAA